MHRKISFANVVNAFETDVYQPRQDVTLSQKQKYGSSMIIILFKIKNSF